MIQSTFALPAACKGFLKEFANASTGCQQSIEAFKEASGEIVSHIVIFDFFYVKKLMNKMSTELPKIEKQCGVNYKNNHSNPNIGSTRPKQEDTKSSFFKNAEAEARGFFNTVFGGI